jgi:uncharacterized tellurite resistance protein B-like protein
MAPMSLLRILGLGGSAGRPAEASETETVRRIAARLERLEPAQAKYLACFAYVLARVANADLEIDPSESRKMEETVRRIASLSEAEAALVVEIAKNQARLFGGTENYVVTREFRRISDKPQRAQLLQCLFAIAAADGSISGVENAEINAIAEELGFTGPETNALRSQFRDKLSVLKQD